MNNITKRILIPVATVLAVFTSCSSDLDVNAPYKDVTVVYGLLNQSDTTHYIKINKAFLGQADANVMAQVKDSSDYGDILDVQVIETKHPQNLARVFTLQRTLITNKEPGVFYAPDQYVYKFQTFPSEPLHQDARYELYIKNRTTEKEITSRTEMVDNFDISLPKLNSGDPQYWSKVSFVDFTNKYVHSQIKWVSAKDARRYNVVMTFNYIEQDTCNGTNTNKAVEWKFSNIKSKSAAGGEAMEITITAEEFFGKIGTIVPVNGCVKNRVIGTMDFSIALAGEELNTFMEVNEPSTGIIQEKPEYTNIVNGIGVFSSRYNKEIKGKILTSNTIKELSTATIGGHTVDRSFCDDSPGSLNPCK